MATRIAKQEPVYFMVDFIDANRGDSYPVYKVTCRVVKVNYDEDGTRRIRNLYSSGPELIGFEDLTTTGRFWHEDRAKGVLTNYSWDTEYLHEGYATVDLRRAKAMVSTLTRYQKGIDRSYQVAGTPMTFGEYASRTANVLGLDGFVWRTPGTQRPYAGTYDEGEWTFASLGVGRMHIDRVITEWFEAGAPKPAEEVA